VCLNSLWCSRSKKKVQIFRWKVKNHDFHQKPSKSWFFTLFINLVKLFLFTSRASSAFKIVYKHYSCVFTSYEINVTFFLTSKISPKSQNFIDISSKKKFWRNFDFWVKFLKSKKNSRWSQMMRKHKNNACRLCLKR